ncbi:MAG: hypothetical protein CMM58_11680 [Rhodospirillaceae bacterium]|nr:hypothetical protein [Rhodospirillaceae bacterium]|tara:strand:+ start:1763 stop:2992 length:1230 start_codon:yes stop_codon:yes gene_type:complete
MMSRVKKKKGERKDSEPEEDSSFEEINDANPVIRSRRYPSTKILSIVCLIIAILVLLATAYFKNWHIQIPSFVSGFQNDAPRHSRSTLGSEVTKNTDKFFFDNNSKSARSSSEISKIRRESANKVSEIKAGLAEIRRRVANLEKWSEELDRLVLDKRSRLTDLKTHNGDSNIGELKDLRNRISDIEAHRFDNRSEITKLKSALKDKEIKNSELNKKIISIEKRIVAQALDTRAEPDRAALLIFSISQISNAISRSEPFSIYLGALQAAANGNVRVLEIVGELKQYTQTGVPTLGYLKKQFRIIKNEIFDQRVAVDNGLVGEALSKLGSLVKVRKLKGVGADIEYEILIEAEKALNGNDIRGAIERLSSLDRSSSSNLDSWLQKAMARMEVEKHVTALKALALTELAKGS